jgi:hypothetical protein
MPFSSLDLNDLIELRKLRKARQGIDAAKLNKGDARKKKKRPREEDEAEVGGLRKAAPIPEDEECVSSLCCMNRRNSTEIGMMRNVTPGPDELCEPITSLSRPMHSMSTSTCWYRFLTNNHR